MLIDVVAMSSAVSPLELRVGLRRLRDAGALVRVHPDVLERDFLHSGTDDQRAAALIESAWDEASDVIWAARGGYGAAKLLPRLRAETALRGKPPHKLLVGYSDITAMHEFARRVWGWSTLHAPMIQSGRNPVPEDQWRATLTLVAGLGAQLPWDAPLLRFVSDAPEAPIEAPVVGGNLCLLATLCGTPAAPSASNAIAFFEDVGEKLYRIDRYVVQLEQSGYFDGCRAIVLGDFTDCDDEQQTMPDPTVELERVMRDDGTVDWEKIARVPLRETFAHEEGLERVFGRVARSRGIPLAMGLPIGHGPHFWPLPLGATHRLTPEGALQRLHWSWPVQPEPA